MNHMLRLVTGRKLKLCRTIPKRRVSTSPDGFVRWHRAAIICVSGITRLRRSRKKHREYYGAATPDARLAGLMSDPWQYYDEAVYSNAYKTVKRAGTCG